MAARGECKIVTWDTRTGVSRTRLVFMVPRTSVTVCKSVPYTFALARSPRRNAECFFDLRIVGGRALCATHDAGNIIALRAWIIIAEGLMQMRDERTRGEKNVNLPTRCINQHTDARSVVLRGWIERKKYFTIRTFPFTFVRRDGGEREEGGRGQGGGAGGKANLF